MKLTDLNDVQFVDSLISAGSNRALAEQLECSVHAIQARRRRLRSVGCKIPRVLRKNKKAVDVAAVNKLVKERGL